MHPLITILPTWIDFSWSSVLTNLILMFIAFLLALPVGWDREQKTRSAGLRTFPLVAMASCGFMLIASQTFDDPQALSRALQGVIGGIGFIGGGAILKHEESVKGTATAASLWATGAIGVAVAWGLFEIAALTSCVSFLVLVYLKDMKSKVEEIKGSED